MKRMVHKRNLEKSTRIDEENKKQNYWKIFLSNCAWCLQIYLELYKANWIMKLEPHKVQDLISTMALELHKNSKPINCDKFCKIAARLLYFFRQNYTLNVFHLSFFVYFEFWSTSFFYAFITLWRTQIQNFRNFH